MHASQCETCQICKATNRPPKAPLLPVQVPELPMHFITIDVAYVTKDEDGFHILLIGDLFSKYITAVALREQTAEEICYTLKNGFSFIMVTQISYFQTKEVTSMAMLYGKFAASSVLKRKGRQHIIAKVMALRKDCSAM